jgi:tetratricopeptide (TPR) repeat protein
MTFIWLFFPFLFTYEVAKSAFGRRGFWKFLLFALFLAGLASGVYWAVKVAYLDAFPRRFRNAVADGRLTRPLGDNAVEIYRYEKTRHPESPDLAPAAAVIKERVLPKGERAFEALNRGEEKGTDWAEVETIYDFLSTEYPGEADHAARRSFAKGQRAFRLGKDEEALANYKAALTQEPRWALALDAIGKVYAREGSALRDESLALRYFDEAGRADPTFPWGYRDTAEYFASKGNNAAAELYLRKAVAADAQQPSNLRRLGDVCLQSMKQGEARRFYEKSLWYETDPEEAERTREKIRAIKGAPPASAAPAPTKTP